MEEFHHLICSAKTSSPESTKYSLVLSPWILHNSISPYNNSRPFSCRSSLCLPLSCFIFFFSIIREKEMLYWKRKTIQNILKGCLLFCKKLNSVFQNMNPSPLYLLFSNLCDEAFIRYNTAKITRELTTSGKVSYCLTTSKFVVHNYLQYTCLEAQKTHFLSKRLYL